MVYFFNARIEQAYWLNAKCAGGTDFRAGCGLARHRTRRSRSRRLSAVSGANAKADAAKQAAGRKARNGRRRCQRYCVPIIRETISNFDALSEELRESELEAELHETGR